MKIKCIKEIIDTSKIYFAIDKFIQEHNGDKPSYIVMNFETQIVLQQNNYNIFYLNNNEGKISTFHNIPIAVSDNLKYGEVDIV